MYTGVSMAAKTLLQKLNSALVLLKRKIAQQDGVQYIKVNNIEEIKNTPLLDYHDLSALDLREYKDLFMYAPTDSIPMSGIRGWTTNVIWPMPDKMPKDFRPNEIMERAKESNVKMNSTGHGINIAIIDNMLDTTNPEYADRIRYFQGPISGQTIKPSFHASMVMGQAVGKHTGVAPDANVYFFTKVTHKERKVFAEELCKVLRSVIKFNQGQTEENKIHILSCSWGARRKYSPQVCELLDELQASGIKVILCGSDDMGVDYSLSGRDFMPCNNPNMTDVQPNVQAEGEKTVYMIANKQHAEGTVVGIPTNMRTTPHGSNGWQYMISGGESSSAPYLAGIYACALSGNKLFMTRPNWQAELNDILKSTATKNPDGNYMINPTGIRARVNEIVKQMQLDIINQQYIENKIL